MITIFGSFSEDCGSLILMYLKEDVKLRWEPAEVPHLPQQT